MADPDVMRQNAAGVERSGWPVVANWIRSYADDVERLQARVAELEEELAALHRGLNWIESL